MLAFLEPHVPVVQVVQVPKMQDPYLQIFEKFDKISSISPAQRAKTSERLGTTPDCHMKPARSMWQGRDPPLAAELAPPMWTTPVVEAPSVVEHVQPDPVTA